MFVPKLYHDQMLYAFYMRRGKSLAIPHLLYVVQRLLKLKQKNEPIRILDVGCGDGNLLEILHSVAKVNGFEKRIELHGLDKDEVSLETAKKKKGFHVEYHQHDICSEDPIPVGNVDVLIVMNTMHEVFSEFLQKYEDRDMAKKKTLEAYGRLSSSLSDIGSLVLYDGVEVDADKEDLSVEFRLQSSSTLTNLLEIVEEYMPYTLTCRQTKDQQFVMPYRDFLHMLTSLKYVDTPLWNIERKQSYQYYNQYEFFHMLEKFGFASESVIVMNSDLGLWKSHINILSPNIYFPKKSIILVGTKNYKGKVSKFDLESVVQFG
jgi:SAM-dependent methyltransferase